MLLNELKKWNRVGLLEVAFRRFVVMLIDMCLIGILLMPLGLIATFLNLQFLLKFLVLLSWMLFFLKDLYHKHGSFGKMKMNLELGFRNDIPNSEIRYFKVVRNITLLIWPIEALVALLNNGLRIGDLIAKTEVMIEQE